MNIFVYGANTQGRHGKGAALEAVQKHGAVYGRVGLCGNSYGVITKELRANYPPITIKDISKEIDLLIICAYEHPDYTFICTPFGTGLAGFSHDIMRALFQEKEVPSNIILPEEWR